MLEWIGEVGIIWVSSHGSEGLIELLDLTSRGSCWVLDGNDIWLINSVQAEKFARSAAAAFNACYVGACLMILSFEKLHLKSVVSGWPWWSDGGLSVILFFVPPARTKSTSRAITLNLRVVRLFGIHDYVIFIQNKRWFALLYNTIANIVESCVIHESFVRRCVAWSRQSFHLSLLFLLLVSGDCRREDHIFLV